MIKDWKDIIAINLTGVFNVTHAFLGSPRANKGRIVNIGSIQSFVHIRQPSSPADTASKHGVLGFTRALAVELGKEGVRVNAIGPGFIETPLNAATRANNQEAVARPTRTSTGTEPRIATASCLLVRVAAFSGVSIKPGPIALTRTPSLPSSTASARVKPSTPCFDAV